LAFLNQPGRRYLLATRRSELVQFQKELLSGDWQRLDDNPDVEVKLLERTGVNYLLARSKPRRRKERAIRRRQRRPLARALQRLQARGAAGRLTKRDKISEAVGRLKAKFPKACPFVTITVAGKRKVQVTWSWKIDKFKAALARDGAYLLQSNQGGWSATEFWETYMQLTVVERAFRVLKTNLLLRPVWHHYSGRTQAHVLICVLAYALWKTLDHLAKRAGLQTLIHKPDPRRKNASPKPRPMTPEVILREMAKIKIGDILLETTDGQQLALRRA
jgi:transposase